MAKTSQVRIIGGIHRGRRLQFPNLVGLRPTGDRMRETLFNWLQPVITGTRCLDLFAGSGALGLEAASRGASRVLMLDIAPTVITQLYSHVQTLQLSTIVQLQQADALDWLRYIPETKFDIVFLDPPFATDILPTACNLLLANHWLAPGALLYLEREFKTREFKTRKFKNNEALPILPATLNILRERRMGQVYCSLAQYHE